MLTIDAERVIVSTGPCECHAVQTTRVHHRDFPELQTEGETAGEAGARLKSQLDRALDDVPSDYRRTAVEHAIADVEEFIRKNG
jgi:hypothetical protein